MRATPMHAAGDVRVEDVAAPKVHQPTDAVVRTVKAGDVVRNITLTGGVAPARAYIDELMPHVLDGSIRPGRVFDRTVGLEDVADGYRAMNDREALEVLVRP